MYSVNVNVIDVTKFHLLFGTITDTKVSVRNQDFGEMLTVGVRSPAP